MLSMSGDPRGRLSAQGRYVFGVAESLIEHPRFIEFIHDIIRYLQISDKGWEFLLHVRRDSNDSVLLKNGHPELFKVPNDILNLIDTLRTGERWSYYKKGILERFSERANDARKLFVQIPETRPPSYASTASSMWSSLPLYSSSEESVRSSISSGYISDWSAHDHQRAVSHGRAPWEADAAKHSVTPSPAAQMARRMVEPKKCPACDKAYNYNGNLVNHLRLEHPEHPAAKKHNSKDSKDWPTASSNVREGLTESMPPPHSRSSTIKPAISDHVASGPEPKEKPLPPVPKKDGSKRPLPDSPTSQVGPRAATEPVTDPRAEFESDSCSTNPTVVVEDTWTNNFNDELFEEILGNMTEHHYSDTGQGVSLVE